MLPTVEEAQQKSPIVGNITGLAGDILNIVVISRLTMGLGIGVSLNRAVGTVGNLAPYIARVLPAVVEGGIIWGSKGFLDESLKQFGSGKTDWKKIAGKTTQEIGFGGVTGVTGAIGSTVARVGVGTLARGG